MMRLRAVLSLLLVLAFAITFTSPPAFAQAPDRSETQAPAEPGYFDAELEGLDAGTIKALGLVQDHAILIEVPAAGGPAEKMGLLPGDVIVTLNGTPVPAGADFIQHIEKSGRGTQVTLAVWRRGQIMTLSVPLAAVPQTRRDVSETLEREIAARNTITAIFARDAFPTVWAMAQNNLGNAYWSRIRGNRAENLEAAIKA
jgi:membrane-associated protease RseP (regulator of RpoE activity)